MKNLIYSIIASVFITLCIQSNSVEAQTVSYKYKPDFITALGNNAIIRVITPKAKDRKLSFKKNTKNDDETEVITEVTEKKREKVENPDGSVTETIDYSDGSVLEETTYEDGSTSKTTISPNGYDRSTIEESADGYITETITIVEEEKKTIKVTTTVTTKDDTGAIIADTTKEKIVEK